MNARRNADLCLWCDEIWSPDHIHSCFYVPDHNCMFTCGEDFEIFAFVKVAKEGLKHVVVNKSQGEALIHCAEKVFEEMGDTNLCISSKAAIICSAPQVFDELSHPVLRTNRVDDECTNTHGDAEIYSDGIRTSQIHHYVDEVYEFGGERDNTLVKEIHQPDAQIMLDEFGVSTFIIEMAEAAKIADLDPAQDDSLKDSTSKKEMRQQAKELAKLRKKKRKRHFTWEQELSLLWEKMGRHNIGKEERSKFVTEVVQKMKGKTLSALISHQVSCRRVLNTA